MSNISKKEALILFLGDIFFFIFSLWLALWIRFGQLPTQDRFITHFVPFSFLFVVWFLVYFIAGLYEKHTLILKSKLPSVIFNAQIVNSIFAVIFFYTLPVFGITPKTLLFVYLVISFICILLWRLYGIRFISRGGKQPALLIGSGAEMKELLEEVNANPRYGLSFISSIDLSDGTSIDVQEDIITPVYSNDIKIIVIDFSHEKVAPFLPHLYNLIFSKVRFIDSHRVYEDIFDRIPLSLVTYSWFLENISVSSKFAYDFLKRTMDIIISLPLFLVSLIMYPFVFAAIKLEDGNEIFSVQQRIGQNNHVIKLIKFRTMLFNDNGDWKEKGVTNRVTKVGAFLRKTRLDEFPQLWNVLKGDISLIGPRPEFPEPVRRYSEEIPYYNIRHIIKPGLSGWAQIYGAHPHHGTDVSQTREKLSYDIFYIKSRSFWLDIKIALKTIKELISRRGI